MAVSVTVAIFLRMRGSYLMSLNSSMILTAIFMWKLCHSVCVFTYLYKYLHKGPDHAQYRFRSSDGTIDEIVEYIDGRYLSSHEAAWRIMGYYTVYTNTPSGPDGGHQCEYNKGRARDYIVRLLQVHKGGRTHSCRNDATVNSFHLKQYYDGISGTIKQIHYHINTEQRTTRLQATQPVSRSCCRK
jgi:hypothetical protein